jgi:hypothetical protein
MKNVYLAALLLGGSFAAHSASAACTYPVGPGKFPDGSVASKEEMQAAKKTVVKYNSDMDAYLACIKAEYDAKAAEQSGSSDAQKADLQKMYAQKEAAAIKEVTDLTELFNVQLRAWKAKNPPEKKSS